MRHLEEEIPGCPQVLEHRCDVLPTGGPAREGFPDLPGTVGGEQITERVEVAPVHGVREPGREVADVSIDREAFDGLLKAGIHIAGFLRSLSGWMV
jgi:hypothetical protein